MKSDLSKYKTGKKKRKSQIPVALVLTIIVIAFGFYLNDVKLISYWVFGLIIGWILQRSRFCFTAAFRDPVITGDTSILRAVLLALGITTLGFSALNIFASINGESMMGMDSVTPLTILTVVGGILFGIGMVIAGGCATGMLFRIGEGFQIQLIVFLFFMIGAVIGSGFMGHLEPLFSKAEAAIHLPQYLGWTGALIFQFVLIITLYIVALKWEKSKLGKENKDKK